MSIQSDTLRIVTFVIDDTVFAVPLESVTRVEQAVAVTAIPGAPKHLMGVINHHGQILPVIDMRVRLGLKSRPLKVTDQFLLVCCHKTTLVLPVDKIEGIITPGNNLVNSEELVEVALDVQNLVALEQGIVMISYPEKMLKESEVVELTNIISYSA